MHRFFLPPDRAQGDRLALDEGDAHHARHVLRLRDGDPVQILDGAGTVCDGHFRAVGRRDAGIEVVVRRSVRRAPGLIGVALGLPKGKAMDWIVQKATELGTERICPLCCERSEVHLDVGQASVRAAKWHAIAIEALKQCGSAWLPQIDPPRSLADFLNARAPWECWLLGSLETPSAHPRQVLDGFFRQHGRLPATAGICVGPEGDFSPAEAGAMVAAGAARVTLGPQVLRTETAAVYGLSVLRHELSDPTDRSAPSVTSVTSAA